MTKLGLVLCILFLSPGVSAFPATFQKEFKNIPIIQEGGFWVSEWVEMQIPQGLSSLQFLVSGSSEALVQLTDLIGPDGMAFVDSGAPLNPYSRPVLRNVTNPERSESVVPGFGSLIYPNNPALPAPSEGVWRFRSLSRTKPGQLHVTFLVRGKHLHSPLNFQNLRARLWLSPGSVWTKHPRQLHQMIAQTKKNLKTAGLLFHVLSQELLERTPTVPMKAPRDMARIALQKNDPDVLNIYLMPEMEYQSQPLNGLACLGGPVGISLPHPCFVSLFARKDLYDLPLEDWAKVLTHEIGHYLGLFHTRDDGYPMGVVEDSLEDTDSTVTGRNMMDPGLHHQKASFSPLQIKMMALSPALYGP